MATAPLVIEGVMHKGRAKRCAICKGQIRNGEPIVSFTVNTNKHRRFDMHGGRCAMAALFDFMRTWNAINNGGAKWVKGTEPHIQNEPR